MMAKYGKLKANITKWRRTLETEVEEHENEVGSDFRAAVSTRFTQLLVNQFHFKII